MKKYFTLIELLLVVVIINILLTLLLTVLKTGKDKVEEIVCIDGKGEMAYFATLYSEDERGKILHGGWGWVGNLAFYQS